MNKRTQPCTIDGCGKLINTRGWCSMHYERWRTTGTTDSPRSTAMQRIKASVTVSEETGCWTWTGLLCPAGYGRISYGGQGRTKLVHRLTYELTVGPIPRGLELDHVCHTLSEGCPNGTRCRHRRCCNPEHVEPVTRTMNMHRSLGANMAKWRARQGLTIKRLVDSGGQREPDLHVRCALPHRRRPGVHRVLDDPAP